VVLLDTPQQAATASAALDAEREREPIKTIAAVLSQQKLLPDDQPRRLELLRQIFSMLTPRVLERLTPKSRTAIERVLRGTELRPVTLEEVPWSLRRAFVERDGTSGKLVFVRPSLENASKRAGRMQISWARKVREVAQQAVPSARVAGSIILSSDIVTAIQEDGLFAAGLSLLVVMALTVLALRSLRHACWVIGSLLLGVLWLGALLQVLSLKLNFVNFVVLPITFGIGTDYAVNLYQRYRQLGRGSVPQAVAASGWPIALCSATTIIGYATLLVADNRAIFSFGASAVLGEITCLTAALVALPAALVLRDGERRTEPRE
jgi:predicted RND superfamily exporter protein